MVQMNALFSMPSYMEDIVEDVTPVEVAEAPEVVEEVTDNVDAETEVTEAVQDVEAADTAAEEMCACYDEIDRMVAHIQRFGVDRSFLSLMNYNNRLSKSFGISFPACENFDTTGNPCSRESVAALEGLKEAAKSVWEFIKKICRKIVNFVTGIVSAISNRLTNVHSVIGRLRKALKERTDISAKDAKDIKVDIAEADAFNEFIKFATDNTSKFDEDIKGAQTTSSKTNNTSSDDEEEKASKAQDEFSKKCEDLYKKLTDTSSKDVTDATRRANGLLNTADNIIERAESLKNSVARSEQAARTVERNATALSSRDSGSSEDAKILRDNAKLILKITKNIGVLIRVMERAARLATKYAASLIQRGTESK